MIPLEMKKIKTNERKEDVESGSVEIEHLGTVTIAVI
jgi:hypothetical protein